MESLIKSRLILGGRPSEETLARFMKEFNHPPEREIGFIVFQAEFEGKTFYCAWAGGEMSPQRVPRFTLVGLGAYECLENLPMGNGNLFIQELRKGKTPIPEKIRASFRDFPDQSKVCFIGDMAKELDGCLGITFEMMGEPIFLPQSKANGKIH